MYKRIFLLVSLMLSLILFSNCATIVSGKQQSVSFSSTPDGATVSVDGRILGKTPMTINLERKSGQNITFEKEGYAPRSMPLATTMNSWFLGNIITGGLLGSTTDGLSGAMYEYSPNNYHITLSSSKNGDISLLNDPKHRARLFILSGYTNIMQELSSTKGEYFNSLMEFLHVDKSKYEEAATKLQSLANLYKNIPEFADKVVEFFMNKPKKDDSA